jgi:hypothetical protein
MMDVKTCPNHGHTHCVPPMCGGAMLIENGQQFNMKLIIKIVLSNLQVTKTHEWKHIYGSMDIVHLTTILVKLHFQALYHIWYDHKLNVACCKCTW